MDDAELLRHAASLMRRRAEAATPGPWWVHRDSAETLWYGDEAETYRLDADPSDNDARWDAWAESTGNLSHGDLRRAEDALHIAGMQPLIGLAVADLLEMAAGRITQALNPNLFARYDGPTRDAVTVARAYAQGDGE